MKLLIYLPKTSNSTFTKSFFFKYIKLVKFSVFGIIAIWNPLFKILAMVNDTPLIVIDPFETKYFLYFLFKKKLISQDFR